MTKEQTTRYACPVCGTVHDHQSERYKNYVCNDCAKRADCTAHGRNVIGYNTSPMGGGFAAWHADRGDNQCWQVTADGLVVIDGTTYRMREAYMGGIVTTPLPGGYIPVEQTLVWSREGHIEWTSAGNPAPFVGYVGEKNTALRQMLRRPSTWEWMVRRINPDVTGAHHVVKQGTVTSIEAAKTNVVEVLNHLSIQMHESG